MERRSPISNLRRYAMPIMMKAGKYLGKTFIEHRSEDMLEDMSQEKSFKEASKFQLREVARCKKPHTIAEELILRAAIEIVETMFGDNFAKELQSIPLSNDTVSRRIDDIAEDVEQQLFGKLRDKLFSIQLNEATDSNKDAHFIAYVRFWDGMSAVEELIL
ncbi:SCAN domain-containing protein 3 [Trichonephila clavipes]|nr:SCAN domain-containing protein 3 [Trichonephila clavipes]